MILLIIGLGSIFILAIAGIYSFLLFRYSRNITWLLLGFGLILFVSMEIVNYSVCSLPSIMPAAVKLLAGLALLVAVLSAPRILQEYEKADTHLKTLWDIDRIMLTSLTPKNVIGSIKSRILEIIDCDALAIYTLDKSGNYTLLANHNLNQDFHDTMLSRENDFFWTIVEKKKTNMLSNLTPDTNFGFPALLKNSGFKSCVGVPLIIRGLTIGGFFVFSNRTKIYGKKEVNYIEGIGRQFVIAIERIQAFERIKEQNVESVLALVQAIELRDPYTKGHSLQVANLAVEICRRIDLSDVKLGLIEFAGLLHDIGKIAVPEIILNKPASLNTEEWRIMKRHPIQSAEIIKPIKDLQQIVNWVLYHHERWDGSGYPQGLKSRDIPLESRILAICDAFSAMVGKRPYRDGFTIEEAIEELKKFSGKQFDPDIVKIFLSLPEETIRRILPEKPS